jgi:nicotinamide N-methyltransferase
VFVKGYIWGQGTVPLLELLPQGIDGYDVIMLSDLIFNHSQHDALLDTCERVLSNSPGAGVFVFYTHHRPHLAHRDMEFFEKARRRGWTTDEIVEETYPVRLQS